MKPKQHIEFLISIVRSDGGQVLLYPRGKAEHDMVEEIVTAAQSKAVGVFATRAQVGEAVREACIEVLRAIKSEVRL